VVVLADRGNVTRAGSTQTALARVFSGEEEKGNVRPIAPGRCGTTGGTAAVPHTAGTTQQHGARTGCSLSWTVEHVSSRLVAV